MNTAGLAFYERLIDALLDAGITPMVTLYHWDLPGELQDRGGWANREIVNWFTEYASIMFERLGDRVKFWITLNEPWVVAHLGYFAGVHAPGMKDMFAALKAVHHLLLAHASAVKAFRDVGINDGKIGITVNLGPQHSATDEQLDREATQRWDAYLNRLFLDPIFLGEYPREGVSWFNDAMPKVTNEDMAQIHTPIDFVGVNYYTRSVIKHDPNGDLLHARHVRMDALHTEMGWEVYPQGLYETLSWVKVRYGSPVIYITENGAAFRDTVDPDGQVRDEQRVKYLHEHFIQAHRAIQDGVDLRGYFVWSLLDNFEWAYGYSKRFGIIYVDYATQRRIVKQSGRWYAQVIKQNAVQAECS